MGGTFKRVFGRELKPGDVIETWWQPTRDTITALEPYAGPLTCFKDGARIASFAMNRCGMTIDNGDLFNVVAIEGRS